LHSPSAHDAVAVLRRLRYLVIGLLTGLLGLALVLLLLWALVVVPPRLIDTSGIADPAKRLDEVNGLRTTLAGVLGGLAVIAGAVVGALNLVLTQRVQWRAQVTERFTRAVDQLGSEKLDVRIGAVYALEQIARDSADLYWPIMEVLTAYLREHARAGPDVEKSTDTEKLPADQQAIATVIGRRRRERDPAGQRLDLQGTRLPGVRWVEAHLEGAFLNGAHLDRANLSEAHLEGANLREAHLEGANLHWAHLEEASFFEAHLKGASLSGAHLEGATLIEAHLEGANLSEAHLEGATLIEANLEGANLAEAHLEGAHLAEAHLKGTNLSEAHVDRAARAHLERPEPAGDGRTGEGAPEVGPAQD
jgi:uncharacterized protein YjbI with pentapeptide repeats